MPLSKQLLACYSHSLIAPRNAYNQCMIAKKLT